MRRFELTDEQWERVKPFLPGQKGMPGHHAKDNRLFLEAVLWIARTGAPWRIFPRDLETGTAIFVGLIVGARVGGGRRFSRHCRIPI